MGCRLWSPRMRSVITWTETLGEPVCVCEGGVLQVLPPPSWGGREGPWRKVLGQEQNQSQAPLATSPESELLSPPSQPSASPKPLLGSRGWSCKMCRSLFINTAPGPSAGLGVVSFPSSEGKRGRTFSHLKTRLLWRSEVPCIYSSL